MNALKIAIINKSDSTGGAAVVSRRLMDALRDKGVDARMFVAERKTGSPYVHLLAPSWRLKGAFILDRLAIARVNGFNRSTLFKLDSAAAGIDISEIDFVKEADVVMLNWINQGVVSLKGISKLLKQGKRVIWTMHDMWNFTGLCHHAGECEGFDMSEPGGGYCGFCPLLGKHASRHDYSYSVNVRKERVYDCGDLKFVAVSSWLAEKAKGSRLLGNRQVVVIPNAFPLPEFDPSTLFRNRIKKGDTIKFVFGAARLDDPIKDFGMLISALKDYCRLRPDLKDRTVVTLYGGIKDVSLLEQIPIRVEYRGMIYDHREIEKIYKESDVVLSTSRWETLPGTLIEGQAFGCWPIAFESGGQRDIIEDEVTGSLVARTKAKDCMEKDEELREQDSLKFAKAMIRSVEMLEKADRSELSRRLYDCVRGKFGADKIAERYLQIL